MEAEEIALIRRAQQGEHEAFGQIVRRYDRRVLSLAYDLMGNLEDAKDVYQEVFLRIYRGLRGFRFESEFATWVYRVTVNCAISYGRRKRSREFSLEGWDGANSLAHQEADPHASAEWVEFRGQLARTLDLLSPKERAVFVLRHTHSYKLTEIAELLEMKLGTVKNYLFRATQKVRRELGRYLRS